jgi:hypothetical protein
VKKEMKETPEKRVRSNFDKLRLALRIIGLTCGAIPVLFYFAFAISFDRIQIIKDYENSTVTVVKDLAYQISEFALPIANFGWTYLLPFFFVFSIFDIIVAVRRQISDGERKMY